MKNSLVRKIGMKLILPLAFAGVIGSGCSKTYVIDENQVKKNHTIFNHLVENKGDSIEIKYNRRSNFSSNLSNLSNLKINGVKYRKKDSLVYEVGNEHYHYLLDKVYSIKNAERQKKIQLKMQKKESEKQAKINHGLKAFE